MFDLVVTQEFNGRQPGDRIVDAAEIEAVLAEHPACVVRVAAEPVAPARAPDPAE